MSNWMPGGGGSDRPSWSTPNKRSAGGAVRQPMPGGQERPLIVTINVRRDEKFLEVQHEYCEAGTMYSMLQQKFIELGRRSLLSLQVGVQSV